MKYTIMIGYSKFIQLDNKFEAEMSRDLMIADNPGKDIWIWRHTV